MVVTVFRKIRSHFSFMLSELAAMVAVCRIKITGNPVVFKDRMGFRYWLHAGDSIKSYYHLGYTTDSSKVMWYVKRFVKPGSICVDVGARIGAISLALWDAVGAEGIVISVEADPDNIDNLRSNLSLNGCPNRFVDNLALTNYNGIAKLKRFIGRNGWQTIGDPEFARHVPSVDFKVPAMTFSELLSSHQLKHIDFVKIDVEGAEPLVLDGMRGLLKAGLVDKVLFEVNHLMLEGTGNTVDDLIGFWCDFKYQLYLLDPDGEPRQLYDRKWPSGHIGDCLAIAGK